MLCQNCQAELLDTQKFCHVCGAPVLSVSPSEQITNPSRRSRKNALGCGIVALTIFLLIIGLGVVAFFGFGLNNTRQLARVLPASETLAIMTVSPSLLQVPHLRSYNEIADSAGVFAPLILMPGVLPQAQAIREWYLEDISVDPVEDILPWIGREVSVAVVGGGPSPPLVLSAITRNRTRSDIFLEDFREQLEAQGNLFDTYDYWGTEITVMVDESLIPLAYATVADQVVITTEPEALETVIDSSHGPKGETLAEDVNFRQALRALPSNRLGYMIIDAVSIFDDAGLMENTRILESIEQIGMAFSLTEDGVRYDYNVHFDEAHLSRTQADVLRAEPTENAMALRVPDEALLYVTGRSFWETLEAADNEAVWEIADTLEQNIGLNFERDVARNFSGDYALVVLEASDGLLNSLIGISGRSGLGFLLLADVEDQDRAEQRMENAIQEWAGIGSLSLSDGRVNGNTLWLLEDPFLEEPILGYGISDGYLFMGTSEDALEAAARAESNSLADDTRFQATMQALPEKGSQFIYVDVSQTFRLLEDILDLRDDDVYRAQIEPNIGGIKALGLVSEPLDKEAVIHSVLFILMGEE